MTAGLVTARPRHARDGDGDDDDDDEHCSARIHSARIDQEPLLRSLTLE